VAEEVIAGVIEGVQDRTRSKKNNIQRKNLCIHKKDRI